MTKDDDDDPVLESSVLLDPAVSTLDKLLARCSEAEVVPFNELYSEEVLRASRKV